MEMTLVLLLHHELLIREKRKRRMLISDSSWMIVSIRMTATDFVDIPRSWKNEVTSKRLQFWNGLAIVTGRVLDTLDGILLKPGLLAVSDS